MTTLKNRIEGIMKSDKKGALLSPESILSIISKGYEGVVRLRAKAYGKRVLKSRRLPCKVVSVGNITVGGVGKTPMTIFTVELLKKMGCRVAVVSRGYKGTAESMGGVVSDGKSVLLGPEAAGDEPYMMARKLKDVPVVVGGYRYRSGMVAVKEFNPDVIVLDDAFQHLPLRRDLDILLLDHERPFGNNRLIPRGPLREPLSALKRADAFMLTRSDFTKPPSLEIKPHVHNRPVFRSRNRASQTVGPPLGGKKVYAFSGIGKNRDFRNTLESFGCRVTGHLEFPDHHAYAENELKLLPGLAEKTGAEIIATTEKDYARLMEKVPWEFPLAVIGIRVVMEDESAFESFIKSRLS